jgi:DnaK suppressor protein
MGPAKKSVAKAKVVEKEVKETSEKKVKMSTPQVDTNAGKGIKKKDLEQFKKILLEEKKKILSHLQTLSDSAEKEEIVPAGDSADIASLEINHANLQKIGKRETYLLKKIDLALAKVEDGTYGECEDCGEQIAVARLQARPVAQLCIDCKTVQENNERKFSTRQEEEEEPEEASTDDGEETE